MGEDKPSPGVFDLMAMGLASALMIGIGTGVGIWIDDWLHSSPYGVFGGLAFGLLAAIGNTVRQIRRFL